MDKPIDFRMIAFSQDGKVAATQNREVWHLWDTQTGQLRHELKLPRWVETMRFSPNGKTLVVPGDRQWMSIFDVETGKKIHSLQVAGRVWSLAFSPDGKTLAAASEHPDRDRVIQLWNLANLKAPSVKYSAPAIDSVMFSPDGKTLAWGCYGHTLCFMDPATAKDKLPLESHRGAIKALVYLPDGKRIVSASEDGTIRIWDAATGESLNVFAVIMARCMDWLSSRTVSCWRRAAKIAPSVSGTSNMPEARLS